MYSQSSSRWSCVRCGAFSEAQLVVCPACATWHSFMPEVYVRTRQATGIAKAVPVSKLRPAQGTYPVFAVGAVPRQDPAMVMLAGPPGGGKSTLALRIADSVASHGALFVSAEEGLGETFRDRLRRLEIVSDGVKACEAVHQPDALRLLGETDARWLILDSWSVLRWTIPDLVAVRGEGYSVVLVVHATKGDDPSGPASLEHLVDSSIWVEGLAYSHRKNRFGSLAVGVPVVEKELVG